MGVRAKKREKEIYGGRLSSPKFLSCFLFCFMFVRGKPADELVKRLSLWKLDIVRILACQMYDLLCPASREVFMEFHISMQKCLLEDFEITLARTAALEDFKNIINGRIGNKNDNSDDDRLNLAEFSLFLFEITSLWTRPTLASQLLFLASAYLSISIEGVPESCPQLKSNFFHVSLLPKKFFVSLAEAIDDLPMSKVIVVVRAKIFSFTKDPRAAILLTPLHLLTSVPPIILEVNQNVRSPPSPSSPMSAFGQWNEEVRQNRRLVESPFSGTNNSSIIQSREISREIGNRELWESNVLGKLAAQVVCGAERIFQKNLVSFGLYNLPRRVQELYAVRLQGLEVGMLEREKRRTPSRDKLSRMGNRILKYRELSEEAITEQMKKRLENITRRIKARKSKITKK